jgi:3-oxoacyl-[acyl-carrier protein] reductase
MDKMNHYLVAGGSSGIGLALIQLLIKNGQYVYNMDRSEFPFPSKSVHTFITDLNSTEKQEQDLLEISTQLDGLVITAGTGFVSRLEQMTSSGFQHELQANLNIAFNLSNAALSKLNEGASVVYLSSVSGLGNSGMSVGYAAAKAGIIGLTKSMAFELARRNIRVNCVAPGPVNTPLFRSISSPTEKRLLENCTPLKRIAEPDDIAEVIQFLLSNASRFVTGQVITIDGGLSMAYKPAI